MSIDGKQKQIDAIIKAGKKAWKEGRIQARDKCCGKCAFRDSSPERTDAFEWIRSVGAWMKGSPFFCHEGIKGHVQYIEGEELKMCSGWASMQGKSEHDWESLAHTDLREPNKKYGAGYPFEPKDENELMGFTSKWCNSCLSSYSCNAFLHGIEKVNGHRRGESYPNIWKIDPDGDAICMEYRKSKVLKVTLNFEWFKQIGNDIKKFEYREVKPHWDSRLLLPNGDFREYDFMEAVNGYGKDRPFLVVVFDGVSIVSGKHKTECGEPLKPNKKYYRIELGEVLIVVD